MADIQIMSFNAGELTPLVDGRSDLEKYYFGCRLMENFIPLPYGPAERRPGTYFVAELKDNDKKANLVSFQYSTEQAYILEFGDEYIRFCKDRGQILHGVGTEDISALDNQIAHWLLNETKGTAVDDAVTVIPHDGTASTDASILHATGKVGTGCFNLDGQYDISIPAEGGAGGHANFSFTNETDDTAFSLACWAYVTKQNVVQVLLSKWRDQNVAKEWRFSLSNDRKLQLHLADTQTDLENDVVCQWKLNDDAADQNLIASLPQYSIDDADDVGNTFTISDDGDLSSSFPNGSEFTVEGSTGNDGQYVVVGTVYGAPDFVITVAAVADGTDNGTIAPHAGVASVNTDTFNDTGKINGCLDFGGNKRIQVDDSADFSFDDSGDNPFSIAAWIYVTVFGDSQAIVSKYQTDKREWLFYMDSLRKLYFVLFDESATVSPYVLADNALSTGWHFVVATYDSTGGATAANGVKIYVDGSLVDSTARNNANYVAMENLTGIVQIGSSYNMADYFQDKIDNVIIFDIELNVAQVSSLWNDGNGTESLTGVTSTSYAVADNAISLGWHFLVVTCSAHADRAKAADDIILYVDSAAVDSTAINDADYKAMQIAVTPEEVRIGSQRNSADSANENFWGDKIDEVSVFNDVLTPAEIASLYSTTPYEIESDYLEADLFGLQHAQSADVLYNVHGDYPQSKLIRYEHNLWELDNIVFDWPPFLAENIDDTTITPSGKVGTIELTASAPIFTEDHIGSYWLIKHNRTDNKIEHDFGVATGLSPILVDVKGSWRLRTSGTWTGKIEIQKTYDGLLVLVLDAAPADGIWAAGDIITGGTSLDTCIIVSATDTTHYYIKQLTGSFTAAETLSNQSGNSRACAATWPRYEGWHLVEPFQSVDDQNFNVPGEETIGDAYLRVECTAQDDAALNIILSCERFYHYGIVKITGYTSATSVSATVIRTLGSTAATKLWSEGSWSDERGYPVTVAFYEGRLWHAGTEYRPLNIWGSRINNYENMESGDLDDDAVGFTVDSTMQNMIRWLVGQEVLLIGTSGGEWRLGSSDPADSITPTNPMRPRIQTTYGSKEIQALLLANTILFVDAQGRKVRGAQYIFEKGETGGYDAPDYTNMSEHITESGIAGMAYQQNPYPILWCWRNDGKTIGMLFEPGQKVWGWFPLKIDGLVESIAVESGTPEDRIWIIVKRKINGITKRYIEYFMPRDWGDDQADCFFVDSGLSFDGGDAVTITGITNADPGVVTAVAHGFSDGDQVRIVDVVGMTDVNNKVFTVHAPADDSFSLRDKLDSTDWRTSAYTAYASGGTVQQVDNVFGGLGHLEGETVSVLGDGSVHEDVVVSSGSVTLTDYFNKVHIGLPFTSKLMPMKLAVPGANIRGKKKRIHQIIFSFYKTLGAKFGTTEGEETIPFRRTTDPMGSAPPLFTDEKTQTFPGGYELNGDIYVEQTQPLPMTIRSITAKLQIYE